MNFQLTQREVLRIKNWRDKLNADYEKLGLPKPKDHEMNGSLVYTFIPTELGLIKIVEDSFHKEELDLTEYENW
jgi:hypothetical protein